MQECRNLDDNLHESDAVIKDALKHIVPADTRSRCLVALLYISLSENHMLRNENEEVMLSADMADPFYESLQAADGFLLPHGGRCSELEMNVAARKWRIIGRLRLYLGCFADALYLLKLSMGPLQGWSTSTQDRLPLLESYRSHANVEQELDTAAIR